MKTILLSITLIFLLSCEDKVVEPSTTYINTPAACPPTNPETEPTNLSFDGLVDVTNISQTSAKLHWEHVEGFHQYHIINLATNERKILKSLNAPKKKVTLNGLTPDTEYQFIVRALDKTGRLDSNLQVKTIRTLPWPNYANLRSIQLNGAQSLRLAASNKYNLSKKLTISTWFKTANANDHEGRIITFHRADQASSALSLGVQSNKLLLHVTKATGEQRTVQKNFDFSQNKWHHVALTINHSKIKVFIDGNAFLNYKAELVSFGNHPAHIGSYTGIQKGFIGRIDEVAIFNNYYGKGDILTIYNQGQATDLQAIPHANDLVSWYQMGDHVNDTHNDLTDVISGHHAKSLNLEETDIVIDSP